MHEPPRGDEPVVQAAGGIVWRYASGACVDDQPAVGSAVEVLVIHRPRYDDWSFPKGKLEPGESHEGAAQRELWEETGLAVALGDLVAVAQYRDRKDRAKAVRYWAMTVVGEPADFTPNDEVDELRWVSVDEAHAVLSYAVDSDILDAFARARRLD